MSELPPQYEDPDALVSIALFKATHPQAMDPGALTSGAPILNFRNGWALSLFIGRRVHWFRRIGEAATALCGVESPLERVFGPGNYPRCQRCITSMSGAIKRGEL
jgi:hypothetical protein